MNINSVRNTFAISLAGFRENGFFENNNMRYWIRIILYVYFFYFFFWNLNFKKILESLIVIFTSHYVFCYCSCYWYFSIVTMDRINLHTYEFLTPIALPIWKSIDFLKIIFNMIFKFFTKYHIDGGEKVCHIIFIVVIFTFLRLWITLYIFNFIS